MKRTPIKQNVLFLLIAVAVALFGKSGSASVNKLLAEAATPNSTLETKTEVPVTNPLDPVPEASPATSSEPMPKTSPTTTSPTTAATEPSTPPIAPATSTKTPPDPTTETAIVAKVIDGDTIELESGEKVRYVGMDTPEITKGKNECYGHEASIKNTELVLGKTITMKKDVSDRDRYGRLLRFVWVGDTFVNAEMIKLGYAAILTIPPDVAQIAYFKQLQAEARSENRGLWSSCGSAHTTSPVTNTSPITGSDCPADMLIKGNASSKIYHEPSSAGYASTTPEACFATEIDAKTAGYRKSKN